MCQVFCVLRTRSAFCLRSNLSKSQNKRDPAMCLKGNVIFWVMRSKIFFVGAKKGNHYRYRRRASNLPHFTELSLKGQICVLILNSASLDTAAHSKWHLSPQVLFRWFGLTDALKSHIPGWHTWFWFLLASGPWPNYKNLRNPCSS